MLAIGSSDCDGQSCNAGWDGLRGASSCAASESGGGVDDRRGEGACCCAGVYSEGCGQACGVGSREQKRAVVLYCLGLVCD